MLSRKNLKELSKQQLKGIWPKAAATTLILNIINMLLQDLMSSNNTIINSNLTILSFTSVVGGLFTLYSILTQSFLYLKLTKEKDIKFSNLLISPKIYLKFILFSLLIMIIVFSLILLYIGLLSNFRENFILTYTIVILISLFLIIAELYISQVPFILVDNPNINIIMAFKESLSLMKGNVLKLLILNLSFIGWFILTAMTFFIGGIFLIPYIYTAKANFYTELKKLKYEKI